METEILHRTLHGKIASIVAEVDHVEKDGFNSQHNYAFTSEAAFLRALRGAMSSRNLTIFPSVNPETLKTTARMDGGKGTITECVVNYTITDGDSGEQIVVSVASQGFDTLDKGAFKAMTGALKYALRQTFMLPTGDDPEGNDAPSGAASATRSGNRSTTNVVPLPEGIYTNGTISESRVIQKNKKNLWLVVGTVAANNGRMIGEAKNWLDLDNPQHADAAESQAVELGIVNPMELGEKSAASEVSTFDHAKLGGNPITIIVESHGDNRAVAFGAPEAVTA